METWRTIPGWQAYQVSNQGRVRRGVRALKPIPVQSGASPDYKPLYVCLSRGWHDHPKFKVAHLVLEAFVGPRPAGYEARHLDDDQANNALSNLAWGTPKQNGDDRVKNGRSAPGSRNGNSVLTEDVVARIKAEYVRYSTTHGAKQLAKRYGCHHSTIHLIVKGATWKHCQ
jgi:hypothetical protein